MCCRALRVACAAGPCGLRALQPHVGCACVAWHPEHMLRPISLSLHRCTRQPCGLAKRWWSRCRGLACASSLTSTSTTCASLLSSLTSRMRPIGGLPNAGGLLGRAGLGRALYFAFSQLVQERAGGAAVLPVANSPAAYISIKMLQLGLAADGLPVPGMSKVKDETRLSDMGTQDVS